MTGPTGPTGPNGGSTGPTDGSTGPTDGSNSTPATGPLWTTPLPPRPPRAPRDRSSPAGARIGRATVHADRVGLAPWMFLGLAGATGVACAVAGQAAIERNGSVDTPLGFLGGLVVGLLAVVGLRSVSIRLVTRLVTSTAGLALLRYGVLSGSLVSGLQGVVVWLVAAVTVFVLADRAGTDAQVPLAEAPVRPGRTTVAAAVPAPAPGTRTRGAAGEQRPRVASAARSVGAVVVVVLLVAALLAPAALSHFQEQAAAGQGPKRQGTPTDAGTDLRASNELDMTGRPELTDEVVFTVDSDRATFWRGQVYDTWDGRTWTQSDRRRALVDDGGVVTGPTDLGATGTDEVVQRVTFRTSYAEVLYAAASAVEIEAPGLVAQSADGTLTTATSPLGRGATYTVTSRRPVLSEARLRALGTGPVPDSILTRYAAPPVITDRVREAAQEVVAGTDSTYDAIVALQDWMGDRTEYSLDAPLSPEGVDVVDHFLFESRQGWCEQVASSLVVLARANGIPARLVTGFVPSDQDPVTGNYLVRQRDAHAWTEVWQQGQGWVRVDPTSAVAPGRTGTVQRLSAPEGAIAGAIRNLNPTLVAQLRATWEAINNSWNQWVLNYTQGRQLDLLKRLGFQSPSWTDLATVLIGVVVLVSLLGAAWTLWERQQHDPWLRLLQRARARLAALGLESADNTPPRELARRVQQRWGGGEAAQRIAQWLLQLEAQRYSRPGTAPNPTLAALQREFRQLAWPRKDSR